MKCIYCGTAPINSTTNPELKVCCCYQLQRVKGIYKQHHRDGRITYPTMTNYEKIKAMGVDEMAEFMKSVALGLNSDWVRGNIQEWLESEVVEGMNYIEAIAILNGFYLRSHADKYDLEALDIGVEAIEKQMPKKPLAETKYYGIGKCPHCGAVFIDKTTNYCGNCGQALDWNS